MLPQEQSSLPTKQVISAGGLVYRVVAGNLEVLLCGRGEPLVWGLPKGTPNPGERLEDAAVREVKEETGLEVRLGPKIGTISYSFVRNRVPHDKTVHHYLMEPIAGSIELHDTEYDVVRWFTVEEAVDSLTYRNEAELVRRAAAMVLNRDDARLEGRLVRLRQKTIADAQDEYLWRTDRELTRLDAAPPFNQPLAEFLVLYADQLRHPPPGQHSLAIETIEGKHIGNCMYYGLDGEKSEVEIGIMIGERAYWDQDYGSDAVSTLLRYLFTRIKLERVFLCTLELNLRAQRCFEKCGFAVCGKVWREGQDLIVMEIRRSQWLQNISAGQAEANAP